MALHPPVVQRRTMETVRRMGQVLSVAIGVINLFRKIKKNLQEPHIRKRFSINLALINPVRWSTYWGTVKIHRLKKMNFLKSTTERRRLQRSCVPRMKLSLSTISIQRMDATAWCLKTKWDVLLLAILEQSSVLCVQKRSATYWEPTLTYSSESSSISNWARTGKIRRSFSYSRSQMMWQWLSLSSFQRVMFPSAFTW